LKWFPTTIKSIIKGDFMINGLKVSFIREQISVCNLILITINYHIYEFVWFVSLSRTKARAYERIKSRLSESSIQANNVEDTHWS